jgi:LPPG:FO 2-phospho-L-lactate transferase
MKITVLAGGVGGSKFLQGLKDHVREAFPDQNGGTKAQITAIVNTGDDLWLAGLRVCPDMDSIIYALGGVHDKTRGWGRAGETGRVSAELEAYGVGWPWFTLGDLDLGTHIARSHWLRSGLTLSEVACRLSARWNPGIEILPMTNSEVETHVELEGPHGVSAAESIHLEEWWVRHRAGIPAKGFRQTGLSLARPAPGVVEAITCADVVVLAPSNPIVSISTILNIPGIRDAVTQTPAPVIGVSPIISGSPVRGMARECLTALGIETTADAVATYYGSRKTGGILDAWLIDVTDGQLADTISESGIQPLVTPLWLHDAPQRTAVAAAALEAATVSSSA